MPRLERSVLIGYGVEVRRAKGMVPAEPNREDRRNGVEPGMVEIEATELVFTDQLGDVVIFPMDETGRVDLVEQLTGVRIVT
jgi:hypothetical protein